MDYRIKKRYVINTIVFVFSFAISFSLFGQDKIITKKFENVYEEQFGEKLFYFFNAIKKNNAVREILAKDKILNEIYNAKIKEDRGVEVVNVKKIVTPFLFNKQDIETIGNRLKYLRSNHKVFNDFILELRGSKQYINFNEFDDDVFLDKTWELCATGLDTVLEVYGMGKKTVYHSIDSMAYNVNNKSFINAVSFLKQRIVEEKEMHDNLFFEPSLKLSSQLLYLNERIEAIRYDPLELGENELAKHEVVNIDFDKYKYGAILVFGASPTTEKERLSLVSKMNLELAVNEFNKGISPFIIVSGGHVRPFMTKKSEAIEMKSELINVYGIPENRIFIEPYARHTTTNIRNAVRVMYSNKLSLSKKSLIVSNPSQIDYIETSSFKARCLRHFGYVPFKFLDKVSRYSIEFLGEEKSLHQNPYQPLDP